ncbi:MAG TPA: biopolymer transporter ExbD [Rhodocyclaceae bacterium]|nr:biopolymer transporter ExbD [Rhodocyclaceae bacterium]
MAFGNSFDNEFEMMSEINVTPLVDVMLVLLIVFMITIPVMTQAVKLDLPRATSQPNQTPPQTITVSIDAHGAVFWDAMPVDSSALAAKVKEAAQKQPQPELHVRADRTTPYENVARVMAAAQLGGISRIGLITQPQP